MTEKEIKSEIRKLKKVKLSLRAGSKERIDLHRKIKELQAKLKTINTIEPEKEKVIEKILAGDSVLKDLVSRGKINLNKFTIEELEKHLQKKGGEK